ncbi:MAG: ornithine carbamoyltransferase [Bacillota bacterium]|nr:ornithine carbamoyltransferase [Bacillota bacterium]
MPFNLKGRSFLTLKDYTPQEIDYLLKLSEELKKAKYTGTEAKLLQGKNIALIFEKPSTRTRCAFIVACNDQGAHAEYLGKGDIQLGKKESVEDTAKVLGRMFDGIQFRGFKHQTVELLAQHSGVPVWNGLTDLYHPTQVLADFLTIKEYKGHLRGISLAYVGDGRNNVANSLMIGSAKVGIDFRIVSPKELFPSDELVSYCRGVAEETGASITITDDIKSGVKGCHALYTDVWVSMGEEAYFEERIKQLKDYQVNMEMIKMTGKDDCIFLHCLPSFHDTNTTVGQEIYEKYGLKEMEVTDEVFRSKHSVVFDEAENRVHTIKAVMVATL